jgi:hypothetical protein
VFGHTSGLAFNSPAFYGRQGDLVQPQFLSGLPVSLAPAYWLGGLSWLLKANAVIGGFALLAFARFVARAVGPRAAPFATLVLALSYPETHAFRSPYSEPLTQLMLFGGLCLLWDAGRTRPRSVALAGVVLGLTTVVRVDALADLLPLAAVIVVYALSGRARDGWALTSGLLAGVALGAADGFGLHYAYLHDTRHELRLVAIATAGVAVGAVVAVRAGPRLRLWLRERNLQAVRDRLGWVAAVAVPVVALLAYAVRPYVDHPRSPAGDHTADEVGRLQALAQVRLDPHRTYAEESLRWLGWWVGAPAILLAAVGAGLIVRRWTQGKDAELVPVVGTGLAVALLVLWRPSITPDHPWADRRFVPVVLPVLVLVATWVISRAGRWARWTIPVLGLAVLVPTVVTTAPLAWTRTENGQLDALADLCREIPSGSAVLFVDAELAYRWVPAVRDECEVPTGYVAAGQQVNLAAVQQVVQAHGRTLVLAGATADQLAGHDPQHAVGLTYRVDQRTLTSVPDGTDSERTDVWTAVLR